MKRIVSLLCVLSVFTAISVMAAKKPAPAYTVENASYDFGTIREADGSVTHLFTISNTGEAPLIILSATASCGCTKPEYPRAPIKPGESASVKVTYNPSGRPGEFDKTVSLKTNDPKHRKAVLRITGTVIPAN